MKAKRVEKCETEKREHDQSKQNENRITYRQQHISQPLAFINAEKRKSKVTAKYQQSKVRAKIQQKKWQSEKQNSEPMMAPREQAHKHINGTKEAAIKKEEKNQRSSQQ